MVGCGKPFCEKHGHPHFIGVHDHTGSKCKVPLEEQLLNLQLIQKYMNLKSEREMRSMRFCNECDPVFLRRFKKGRKSYLLKIVLAIAGITVLVLIYFLLRNALETSEFRCPSGYVLVENQCH
mmetsp:Transcript_8499/g.13047  ORF Transcript_8499/g.13047 Transcript_8499/m.13047 type:complete len:123 (+) Transcript_8499:965-1333(+)